MKVSLRDMTDTTRSSVRGDWFDSLAPDYRDSESYIRYRDITLPLFKQLPNFSIGDLKRLQKGDYNPRYVLDVIEGANVEEVSILPSRWKFVEKSAPCLAAQAWT